MPPENTSNPPSYQIPGTAPRRSHRVLWAGLVVVVAVLVLVGGLYGLVTYTPLGTPVMSAWSILTLPNELKTATFVSDGPHGSTMYRIKGLSYVAEPVQGMLVSAEKETSGDARIVQTATRYEAFVNGKELYATTSPLLGISVTPDGTRAVIAAQYAGKNPGMIPVNSVSPTVHPYLWTSVLLHLDGNGAPLAIGSGVASVYLDATHLIRISSVGIVSVDTGNGMASNLTTDPIALTIPGILASRDRTHVAWFDIPNRLITIYRVTATTAEKVAQIKDINPRTSYALGADALYTLRVDTKGNATQILRQAFTATASTKVGSLPGSLHIDRVLIGSL